MRSVIRTSYELPLIYEARRQFERTGEVSKDLYDELRFRNLLEEVSCDTGNIVRGR